MKYVQMANKKMATYVNALHGLKCNKIQIFFHEFCDFIQNYRQNIHLPINPAEKKALSAMMYYFFKHIEQSNRMPDKN
jgi:hypothetical protein